jgi:hypothetical protein
MELGPFTPDKLIAGPFYRVTDWLASAATQTAMARGTILTSAGAALASDGTAPYAILAEDVTAGTAAVQMPVYLTGEFNIHSVAAAGGFTPTTAQIATMRGLGIFIKKAIADTGTTA